MNALELEALETLANRGLVRVIGRTSYRTARVGDSFLKCNRSDIAFLENKLQESDNHVVLIFQVLWGENGWVSGVYYAFLHDQVCLIGRQMIVGDF